MGQIINIYCDVCQEWYPSTGWDAWDKGNGKHEITCCMCADYSKVINDSDYYGVDFWSSNGRITIEEPQQEIIEPTPEPTPEPTQEEYIVVSDNQIDYTEQFNKIIDNQERIIRQNERLIYHTISYCNVARNVADNQIVSMNDIFNKKMNDYNVSEGLLLLIFILFVGFGIISVIRKAVFKWK